MKKQPKFQNPFLPSSKAICLAGWGQNPQDFQLQIKFILQNCGLGSVKLSALDYSPHTYPELKNHISLQKNFCRTPEMIFGWSLGGQIALQLIADGVFLPKFLILISTPFCLVEKDANQEFKAISRKEFSAFLRSFRNNPESFLSNFTRKIFTDKFCDDLKSFPQINKGPISFSRLLYWLDWLGEFDGKTLDKKIQQATDLRGGQNLKILIIQCQGDRIVPSEQALQWYKFFDNQDDGRQECGEGSYALKIPYVPMAYEMQISAMSGVSGAAFRYIEGVKNLKIDELVRVKIFPGENHSPHFFYPEKIAEILSEIALLPNNSGN